MRSEGSDRTSVFGIAIDRVSLKSASSRLADWVADGERSCRYVVTPNLDHVLLYQECETLRIAYAKASLVVADGWPLVTASRMCDRPLPERVAGSDLVPELFAECQLRGVRRTAFLLGAAPGVAELAAVSIEKRWPNIKVVGTYSPPLGFEKDSLEKLRILELVNSCSPDILIVGFGAPKQELWLLESHPDLKVGVAFAAGATIDFFAGRQKRAPVWMQKLRLEWSHRLLTNPRRLVARYARNALKLPMLFFQEMQRNRKPATCSVPKE